MGAARLTETCAEVIRKTVILSHAEQLEGTTVKQNSRTQSSHAVTELRVVILPDTSIAYRSQRG